MKKNHLELFNVHQKKQYQSAKNNFVKNNFYKILKSALSWRLYYLSEIWYLQKDGSSKYIVTQTEMAVF